MTVRRSKIRNFVGMDITFKQNNRVCIKMKKYLLECIKTFESFGNKIKRGTNTLAKSNIFKLNSELELLDFEKSKRFHHIVYKLLFLYISGLGYISTLSYHFYVRE